MEDLILLILRGLYFLILADVILSWVMPDENQFPRNITREVTTPLYAPIHKVLNPQMTGGFDLSPIVLIVLIRVMESMLLSRM